ncbi:site-specific integrase [Shewanella chilikensis]|uniref:tyrosine-type recombinase/integrase n=1 Tax=Shewanella chilikensis TaxID=558541 RepID=UPI00200ECAAF|nr:site-specific integrase [Shewanella chilikensis]MCL1160474.1 site-specific integrase [Shewanella chilikensis]
MTSVKVKITDSIMRQVPEEVTRINDAELSGFYVQIGERSPNGVRSFTYYLYYRLGGRNGIQRRYPIGNANVLTASEARKEATRLKGRVAIGEDVFLTRKKTHAAIAKSKTEPKVALLVKEFMDIYVNRHRKRPEEVQRMMNADILPTLGKEKLSQLNRRLVINKGLDPILARGSKVQANKTLSVLKQMFDFGIQRGLLDHNPLAGTKRQVVGGNESSRDRHLSLAEIQIVFDRLPRLGISHQVITILKIILLTGCRVNEIASAKWREFDFENQLWTIPKENVKAKKGKEKEHHVPLNDHLIALLDEAKKAYAYLNSEYVFPSLSCTTVAPGVKPIDKRSVARAVKRHIEELGVEPFTPHDLRRTTATMLSELGVDPIVVEKVLNHELMGVMAVYNRHQYMNKRKEALNLLSTHLSGL